ncbi:MAG TPA: right-handed parallel beta-helix repeat-containing protein, partial [Thermoplasmata archaeon]|nr:right-handed parallel beta-helix repeat-containing protein [Thermoplasmata archaeon]
MRISRFGWVVAAMVTVIMLTSSFASAAPRSGPHMVPAGTLASLGLVTIEANGSVVPSGAPISVAGTTYTLTGTINGSLLVVANDVTVDGADHLVNYTVGMVGGDNAAVTVQGSTSDVLENFRSSNSSIGILVEAASGATVRDNSVGGNATSIEVNRSSDVVISGNHEAVFPGEGTGLQVTSSSGVTVTGNVFDERKTGISLENVSRAVVMANSANRTVDAGIDLTNASQVEIVSNWAEGSYNVSSAPDGVYVDLSSYVTISDSSFNGSYDGAFVYDSHDLTFASDNASFTAYGFALEYTVQATVTRSTAFGSGYGLFSEYSEDVTFSNNSLAHDTIGISDEYDSHLLATGNSAPYSTAAGEGVRAFGSSDSTYLDNNLSHAANYGALAEQTSNVTFTGNDLSQFEYYGLYLLYTYGTVTVDGNNLSGSPYFYSVGAESYEPYGPLNFSGNDVKHLYTGLEFYYAYSPIQVYDNDIRFSAQYAVYADSVKGPVTVSDNDLSHSYEGIYSYYQAGGTLSALGNNISDSYSGVISESYGAGYSALTVSGNTLVNDGYGVYLYEIDGPISVTDNNLFNSTYDGVYVFDCVDGPTLISGNNLSNAHYAGVDVYAGAEVTISDNQIVNSTDYGIELGSDYGVDSVFGNDLQRSQY